MQRFALGLSVAALAACTTNGLDPRTDGGGGRATSGDAASSARASSTTASTTHGSSTSATTTTSASASSGAGAGGGGASAASTGGGGLAPCPAPLGESYTSATTIGAPTPDAATQPDLNIKLRGWEPSAAALTLVDIAGPTDANAPKLTTLVDGVTMPALLENDSVNDWDWSTNTPLGPIASPEATMTGLATTPGVTLRLPHGGYEIDPGLEARVLYLDDDSIVFEYTGEDNIVSGYAIHVFDVCVEPALAALYAADVAGGRAQMPALTPNQAFGRARAGRVLVVVRDTGSFMDPRSRKDWW